MTTSTHSSSRMGDAAGDCMVRVLVLDDNAMITDMLGSMLEMFGYRVVTANAGAEAWCLLSTDHFDVVLSDMRMPLMDGREFLSQTACPYLTKPYTMQNLRSVVESLLQERSQAA